MPANETFESDVFQTSAGELKITFLGHGTLMMSFGGKIIHIDPFSRVADYSTLPKADLILITHEHHDHLDVNALKWIRAEHTRLIISESCTAEIQAGTVMHNGDELSVDGIGIRAVPAYNIQHKRDNGQPFHPPGVGNGYVLTFGDTRVYIAGDSEDIPEMKALQEIDIAFLPMNLPYTMTPEMAAGAARAFRPRVLYPYHFGSSSTDKLVKLLANEPGIEVRVRNLA